MRDVCWGVQDKWSGILKLESLSLYLLGRHLTMCREFVPLMNRAEKAGLCGVQVNISGDVILCRCLWANYILSEGLIKDTRGEKNAAPNIKFSYRTVEQNPRTYLSQDVSLLLRGLAAVFVAQTSNHPEPFVWMFTCFTFFKIHHCIDTG